MKKIVIISLIVLIIGILLKEETFVINIHDTYFVVSYINLAEFIIVLLLLSFLVYKLFYKKRLSN